jgi:hypothetical protein
MFARVVSDERVSRLLPRGHKNWRPRDPILNLHGEEIGHRWDADDGSVFLPFDPDEAVGNYRTERYSEISGRRMTRCVTGGLRRLYYTARPAVPRSSQIWARRHFARIQERPDFPRWPIEPALHDLVDLMFRIVAEIAETPVPRLAAWPDGRKWALVLTHDVETAAGYAAVDRVLNLERHLGMRSAWFFVPHRYAVDVDDLRRITSQGLEVGVHGLYHDGRDLGSLRLLRKRLPQITEAAKRWGAVGFRAPALHRRWEWMPLLGFDYDTSYPDTDPYEPIAGGCCSWLPLFIDNLVELPVTLPQDHTLFVILRHPDETLWVQKAELLRAAGGMALIDSHPDYLVDELVSRAYGRFLEHVSDADDAWRALPRDVSAWWRRRAASRLGWHYDGWRIEGPAAGEGRVELVNAAGVRTESHPSPPGSRCITRREPLAIQQGPR